MRASARIPALKHRLEWTFCAFVVAFLGLGWRLFEIQVVDHAFYRRQADRYHLEEITIQPARGTLLDRDGTPLAQNLPSQSIYADPRAIPDPAAVARPLAAALQMDTRSIEARLRAKRESVWLKRGVDEQAAKAVLALGLPGVRVVEDPAAPSGSAGSETPRSVRAEPRKLDDPALAAERLAPILQIPASELAARLTRPRSFVWLKRQVDGQTEAAVRALELEGVHFTREPRRQYPLRQLAANVIGFTNVDGTGIAGLEKQLEPYLAGRPGSIEAEVDALKRIIPGTVRKETPVQDGCHVTLTLSARIQHLAERAIEKAYATYRAAGACAVVLDPQTGEVLAMANRPTYDPSRPVGSDPHSQRNRCVTDTYEPGSTMKAITIAAALEEKAISPGSCFYCGGTYRVGKHTIRCVLHGPYRNGHGSQSITGILRESCNIGTAQIGAALRANRLYRYIADFGFIGDTRLHLLGEQRGSLTPPDTWPSVKLANVSFGQGVAVTPLQMAVAYGAIANGGKLMQPYLIRRIESPDGQVLQENQPREVRQVISPETARVVTRCLQAVVEEGTGKAARVSGYAVAGKTGSAQKAEGGRYVPGKFVASFVGFAPAGNPRVVVIVVVDEPKGSHWGATCAAPAFKEIVEGALWHLKVPPDRPAELRRAENDQS